jgi:hypothetical protein
MKAGVEYQIGRAVDSSVVVARGRIWTSLNLRYFILLELGGGVFGCSLSFELETRVAGLAEMAWLYGAVGIHRVITGEKHKVCGVVEVSAGRHSQGWCGGTLRIRMRFECTWKASTCSQCSLTHILLYMV